MSMAIPSGTPMTTRTAEQREAPGPDRVNDNDGDDRAAVVKAAAPAGMGTLVDKTA